MDLYLQTRIKWALIQQGWFKIKFEWNHAEEQQHREHILPQMCYQFKNKFFCLTWMFLVLKIPNNFIANLMPMIISMNVRHHHANFLETNANDTFWCKLSACQMQIKNPFSIINFCKSKKRPGLFVSMGKEKRFFKPSTQLHILMHLLK